MTTTIATYVITSNLSIRVERLDWTRYRGCTATAAIEPIVKQGKTPDNAALRVARDINTQGHRFGLVREGLRDALDELLARIAGQMMAPDPELFTAIAIAATAMGLHLRSNKTQRTRQGKALASQWYETVAQRRELIAQYCARRVLCGPLGRPDVQYGLILADVPWEYNDTGSRASPDYSGPGRIAPVYETLPDSEIAALGIDLIPRLMPAAILAFWVPVPIHAAEPDRAHRICQAWGFRRPATIVPWIKMTKRGAVKIGMGSYGRGCAELLALAGRGDFDIQQGDGHLYLATRGRAATHRITDRGLPNLIVAPAQHNTHSSKPEAQYEYLEQLCGDTPRLEMFARVTRPGWDRWGFEAPDTP